MNQQLKLIHSTCGAELKIDRATPPFFHENERGTTDIYYGIRCAECGEPLGCLANVDEEGVRAN